MLALFGCETPRTLANLFRPSGVGARWRRAGSGCRCRFGREGVPPRYHRGLPMRVHLPMARRGRRVGAVSRSRRCHSSEAANEASCSPVCPSRDSTAAGATGQPSLGSSSRLSASCESHSSMRSPVGRGEAKSCCNKAPDLVAGALHRCQVPCRVPKSMAGAEGDPTNCSDGIDPQ